MEVNLVREMSSMGANLQKEINEGDSKLQGEVAKVSTRLGRVEAHFGPEYQVAEPKPDSE